MITRRPHDYRLDSVNFKGGKNTYTAEQEERLLQHERRIGMHDALNSVEIMIRSPDFRKSLSGTGKRYINSAMDWLTRDKPLLALVEIRKAIVSKDYPKLSHAGQVRLGKIEDQLSVFEAES